MIATCRALDGRLSGDLIGEQVLMALMPAILQQIYPRLARYRALRFTDRGPAGKL